MSENAPIDSLEVAVKADSQKAVQGIDALRDSLDALRTATKGGLGLKIISRDVGALGTAASKMDSNSVANLNGMISALEKLSALKGLKISTSISTQLTSIAQAAKSMDGINMSPLYQLSLTLGSLTNVGKGNLGSIVNSLNKVPLALQNLGKVDYDSAGGKLQELMQALEPLSNMPKSNLSSTLNQVKKLPDVFKELEKLDLRKFADRIKEIAAALAPLANEMEKVSRGFSAFPAKIQKLLNATQRVPSANRKIGKSYLGMAARMGATIYAMKRLGRAISEWMHESNSYVENLNLFNVAMGEFADEASRYAQKVSEVMGIDPGEWMRNQGVFQTLATGFGVAGDRAYIMSKNLTQLGYDLSSFFNISTADSFQKLQSGLSGELEPLRRLGFDLSKARLEQEALNLGINKNYNAMTQAEKAQLRYVAILGQVTTAQGDMARTLEAPANQMRILRAQVTMAARSLGNIFIPVLNAVLPYAIAVTKVIRVLADAIAKLAGFTLPDIDYSGMKQINGGVGNLEQGLGGAAGKAKELRAQLLGIDELNVLSKPSDGGGSGAGIGSAGGFDFDLPEYDFLGDAASARVDAIVNKMKEWLGLTDEIDSWSDLFRTRLGKILVIVGLIGTGLAAWKIGNGVLSVAGMFKNLGGGASGVVGTIGMSVAGLLTGGGMFFLGIWDAIQNGLDWLNGLIIPAGSTMAGASIGAIVGSLGGPFGTAAGALVGLVVGLLTDIGIAIYEHWDVIWSWMQDTWGKIKDWFSNKFSKVKTTFNDFKSVVSETAKSIWEDIKTRFAPAIQWFSELFKNIHQHFSDRLHNAKVLVKGTVDIIKTIWGNFKDWMKKTVIQPIADWFGDAWATIKSSASEAWKTIKEVFAPVGDWFADLFSKAWEKVVKVFDVGGQVLNNIKEALTSSMKYLGNQLITIINAGVAVPFAGINAAIGKLRGLEIFGKKPFGGLVDITVPKIPYLAQGGSVTAGQMFVAREAGPELVGNVGNRTAVVNNDQIVDAVSEGVYRAVVSAMSNSDGGKIVTAKVNEKVLFEVVLSEARKQSVARGYNPLMEVY